MTPAEVLNQVTSDRGPVALNPVRRQDQGVNALDRQAHAAPPRLVDVRQTTSANADLQSDDERGQTHPSSRSRPLDGPSSSSREPFAVGSASRSNVPVQPASASQATPMVADPRAYERSRPIDVPSKSRTEPPDDRPRYPREISYGLRPPRTGDSMQSDGHEQPTAQSAARPPLLAQKSRANIRPEPPAQPVAHTPPTNVINPSGPVASIPFMVARVPSSAPSVKESQNAPQDTIPSNSGPATASRALYYGLTPPKPSGDVPALRQSPSTAINSVPGIRPVPSVQRVPVPSYNPVVADASRQPTSATAQLVSTSSSSPSYPPAPAPAVLRNNDYPPMSTHNQPGMPPGGYSSQVSATPQNTMTSEAATGSASRSAQGPSHAHQSSRGSNRIGLAETDTRRVVQVPAESRAIVPSVPSVMVASASAQNQPAVHGVPGSTHTHQSSRGYNRIAINEADARTTVPAPTDLRSGPLGGLTVAAGSAPAQQVPQGVSGPSQMHQPPRASNNIAVVEADIRPAVSTQKDQRPAVLNGSIMFAVPGQPHHAPPVFDVARGALTQDAADQASTARPIMLSSGTCRHDILHPWRTQ